MCHGVGIWLKLAWGVGGDLRCTVRLFSSAVARSQPRASAVLPLGKDPSEYGEGP